MRVKKYKRVKRPRIHVELPGDPAKKWESVNGSSITCEETNGDRNERDSDKLLLGDEEAARCPEESDNNDGGGQEIERMSLIQKPENLDDVANVAARSMPGEKQSKRRKIPSSGSAGEDSGRGSALVCPDESTVFNGGKLSPFTLRQQQQDPPQLPPQDQPRQLEKSGNQSVSDENDDDVHGQKAQPQNEQGEGTARGPGDGNSDGGDVNSGDPRDTIASKVSRCSGARLDADAAPSPDGNDDHSKSVMTKASSNKLQNDDSDDDEDEEYENNAFRGADGDDPLTNGGKGGSLWFKVERLVVFLQLLALALDVDGAAWPPLFLRMWSWVWLSNQYLRWPLLILLRRVGREFSMSFGEAELDLWFFRDVIGYGVELCSAAVVLFVLFFVLQMPDYTSHKPKAAWRRSFLTHWFRRTLPWYMVNLVVTFVLFAVLTHYGDAFFPPDVITAVIVVGGTLLTVSWLLVVLLSLLVHVVVRIATKHDAEYSFMIAMKHVVKIKVRSCLFFLQLAYVPVTASIVRALVPEFDWNDKWAHESRRAYNHHVWCYFMGFPPRLQGTAEVIVLECTSTSGVAVHTLSACLVLFYVCGLPQMVRYLVRFLFVGFWSNIDVIRSFLQAREVHHAALEALRPFPQDLLWLARRGREMAYARHAADRLRRRAWRFTVVSLRRVPFIRRLPCLRPRRRKKREPPEGTTDTFNFDEEGNATFPTDPGATTPTGAVGADGVVKIENSNASPPTPIILRDTVVESSPENPADHTSPLSQEGAEKHGAPKEITVVSIKGTENTSGLKHFAPEGDQEEAKQPNKIGGGLGRKKNELERRQHQQLMMKNSSRKPSRLAEFLQRRKKAALGMRQALLTEREAYCNAAEEYVLALSDFESDHSLEITCWESVVDTSGLIYLSESYTWLRPEWKVIEGLERGVFVAAILISRHLGPASTQLLVGALVLTGFQAWTLRAEPFLFSREALLDTGLRAALILVLIIGAAGAGGSLTSYLVDFFLLAVGLVGIAAALLWGEVVGGVLALIGQILAAADDRVNDLLFRQVRQRSLGLEASHTGVRLLMQWDDLLEQQRWSAFLAWPTPTPTSVLSKREKVFVVRWAALRGLDVRRARTSTGLSLLHDSIINAEVEPTRWLVFHYPILLDAETLHKESPLLLGVLETARVLLRIEELTARLDDWGLDLSETASQGGKARGSLFGGLGLPRGDGLPGGDGGFGGLSGALGVLGREGGGVFGGSATTGDKQREADEEEMAELSWKMGRLTEMFLSSEIQNAEVRWNAHQYDLLTEHGEPDMSELAQNLAEAFNIKPPKGYAHVHRWRKRARFTRDCLGEATCASRSEVDLAGSCLGDSGYKSLLSICRALSVQATTFTWPSPFTTQLRINVVRVSFSRNRMRRKSGYRVADMLLLNKTVTDLDLSGNALDSQAAKEIFFAVRKNQVLERLDISGNKIGPEVASSLGGMIKKNRFLTYLDLSDNQMGERKFWKPTGEIVHVPSAGPALGDALRYNKTLIVLKVKGNLLGADTGHAFANGVARHRSLKWLDLSRNLILPGGGKALALGLNSTRRSTLTRLDVADNHLGKKAAKLFSATLKRNRTLRHLDLSRNELGTHAGIAFATSLLVNRTLETLAVAGNGMGPNVAKNLAQSLASNASLRELDLSDNTLGMSSAEGGDSSDVGLAMGHGLRGNKTLTSLNLSGNRLPTMEMQRIAEGLGDHTSLSHLNLAGEAVNDPGALELGRLVAGVSGGCLVSLDLRRSALAGTGAVAVTRALYAGARGLTRLDLSDNILGTAAARELGNALQNGGERIGIVPGAKGKAEGLGVRFLGLARCGLGPVGGALVCRALGANMSVEELDLSDNGLGDVAGVALSRSLRVLFRNGKAVRPCRMRRLDISRNPLGSDAGVAILGALVNECTRHLDLSYTELSGKAAGSAIGRMLRCHTVVLEHLNVEHNNLGRHGINEVFWALRRNASLLHLDLSDNRAGAVFGTEADKLEEYGTTSINSALSLNQTLRFLDLGTNGLSAECGSTLTASIRRNRSLANVSLENNLLDDEAASTFARKLRRDRQIEHLNLNNNRVGWRGGLDLAAGLALNSHLTCLDVGNNMLGEAGTFADVGGKFAAALVRNKTLTRLNMEGNKLGPSGGVAIAEALHRNNSLIDLNLADNRFDQDVGFALEDLLKVNFTLHSIGASEGEIGIDSRGTIDGMLAAREKLLETHSVPSEQTQQAAYEKGGRGSKRAGGGSSNGSVGSMGDSDSGRSTSVGGGGGDRRRSSARQAKRRLLR